MARKHRELTEQEIFNRTALSLAKGDFKPSGEIQKLLFELNMIELAVRPSRQGEKLRALARRRKLEIPEWLRLEGKR